MKYPWLPLDQLSTWAVFNNVQLRGAAVTSSIKNELGNDKGGGLVATEKHESGDVLLVVPRDLVLSVEGIEQLAKADHRLRELLDATAALTQTPRLLIMIFLIYQMTIAGSEEARQAPSAPGPLTDYVKFLPKEIILPTFYSEQERELLIGTSLEGALEQKLASLEKEFTHLRAATESISWCRKLWWDGESADLQFEDWKLVDALYRSRALELPKGLGDSMAPVVDMANHSYAYNARFEVDSNGDANLVVRDGVTISAGEEITIIYGCGGACEMLFSYGFMDASATSARELFLDLVMPEDDPLRTAKIQYAAVAPGVRLFEDQNGQVGWESDFVWWACVNEEDGLEFKVLQAYDRQPELKAFWKGRPFEAEELHTILMADSLRDIFVLRATVLVLQRVEDQGTKLAESEDECGGDSAVPGEKAQLLQLDAVCEYLSSKKIRCDGIRPSCTQCINVGFECKTSDKLSRRAFPRGYTESLEDRVRGLEAEVRELKQLLDEKDEKIDMLSRLHNFSSPPRRATASLSPTAMPAEIKDEPEPPRDEVLHVELPALVQPGATSTGDSTTAAFIDAFERKAQEQPNKLPQSISAAALFHSSQSRKAASHHPPRTPPRLQSDQYINLFFQEWQPLLPILHRPSFLRVYEQYLTTPDASKWQNKDAIAQLFLIFEISALSACHEQKTNVPSYEGQWRRALFSTASAPTITDYTELARHRGVAVGMCHELGLHQGHKYQNLPVFESETRKRVFWCQYVLDKFTSASTGTPMLLRDDDITADYPADVDDENLSAQGFSPTLPGELTKMSSVLALFRASRILSKTLESLYPAKASYQLSINKLYALSDELDQWSEELPEHLRLRFCNDKPSTNVISCRSPLLSLTYFYIRGLIHRPLLCHGTGTACSATTIVHSAAGKHILQILDLLDERRMNYTFPQPRKEILLTAGFSILWQCIDLDHESKVAQDNQKSLSLALNMLAGESSVSTAEFQRIVAAFFFPLTRQRQLSPNTVATGSLDIRQRGGTTPPVRSDIARSAKRQLQVLASRFSPPKMVPQGPECRRATVPETGVIPPIGSLVRARSEASLSSTRSAPVAMSANPPSPDRQESINLDYFLLGCEESDKMTSKTSSSAMLPPQKPAQLAPNIANSSWEDIIQALDPNNPTIFDAGPTEHGSIAIDDNELMHDCGWELAAAMNFASKAHVPQSLLSFSGDSFTSGDDLVFSSSSHNGSLSSTNENAEACGESPFKGITIPMDDDLEAHDIGA
ncbi:hypothetical protein DV735_g494, partial [Chaetothyriales sp. CBS 134920]